MDVTGSIKVRQQFDNLHTSCPTHYNGDVGLVRLLMVDLSISARIIDWLAFLNPAVLLGSDFGVHLLKE